MAKSSKAARPSVFISHFSGDKPFALDLAAGLRASDLDPWIDKERILVGDSILGALGQGLKTMDVFVLLVSAGAVASGWVDKEVEYAAYREITERKVLIVPFVIDRTPIAEVPWTLHTRNIASIAADAGGVAAVVEAVRERLAQRGGSVGGPGKCGFAPDAEVEALIAGQELGDWTRAERNALSVLGKTEAGGRNRMFEALLTYRDAPDQDVLIRALAVAESCVAMAPWLIGREVLAVMARHRDFSVRSSAASMMMDMAGVAPGLVPVDLLLSLSRHDEDWYVKAPANAALKTLAHVKPGLMQLFFLRLESEDRWEREHAASQLADIAAREPEILNPEAVGAAILALAHRKDKVAGGILQSVAQKVASVARKPKYPYGL